MTCHSIGTDKEFPCPSGVAGTGGPIQRPSGWRRGAGFLALALLGVGLLLAATGCRTFSKRAVSDPTAAAARLRAGGSIGAEAVARSTPDGYTLLVGSNGPLTVNSFVQAKLGYDPMKDFAAVALTSYVPHVIILNDKVEAKTLPDLIALSKKQPISIATSGVGSATHMTLERFKAATGANLTHIPYRSGGQLMPDLIGGNIQAAMTEFSTALPLHKAGKARILAIASAQRSQLAPDVATFIEGGVKDFTARAISAFWRPPAHRAQSSRSCRRRLPPASPEARRPTSCAPWERKSQRPNR